MSDHFLERSNFGKIRNTRAATDGREDIDIGLDIMHYLDGSAQLMADTAFGEYIFLYHGKLSIRKTFFGKMFEFEFLVSMRSGADREGSSKECPGVSHR